MTLGNRKICFEIWKSISHKEQENIYKLNYLKIKKFCSFNNNYLKSENTSH